MKWNLTEFVDIYFLCTYAVFSVLVFSFTEKAHRAGDGGTYL